MYLKRLVFFLCVLSLLISGCSGTGVSVGGGSQAGTAAVSVAITDTPPAGVTLLSFEVAVTGAVLNPGNVSLVSSPIEIELKHLETEAAFLNTVNVPAGTYTSITISFANPELTIKNDTGASLAGCAPGAVCEFKPGVAGSVTYSGAPFPLTIVANTPAGLLIDVNLNNVITGTLGVDFNASGGVIVTQLPLPGLPTGQLEEIEDLLGIVKNKDATNNRFTLQTAHGSFVVTVDNNTDFEDFGGCSANNFTCVQNDQVVEVDLILLTAGVLLAEEVELEDNVVDDELEGIVFSVDNATQFKMVVVEELRDLANVDVGNAVTVTIQSGANFQVDENGLIVPASLLNAFEGASDTSPLMPGQSIEVRVRSLTTGPPISVSTDRVRLRMARFTAQVAGAPAPPNFNVDNLPSLFTSAGITQIQVQTSPDTDFEGVSGVSALADNNVVSLRGLLFSAVPTTLIADKVRKR